MSQLFTASMHSSMMYVQRNHKSVAVLILKPRTEADGRLPAAQPLPWRTLADSERESKQMPLSNQVHAIYDWVEEERIPSLVDAYRVKYVVYGGLRDAKWILRLLAQSKDHKMLERCVYFPMTEPFANENAMETLCEHQDLCPWVRALGKPSSYSSLPFEPAEAWTRFVDWSLCA